MGKEATRLLVVKNMAGATIRQANTEKKLPGYSWWYGSLCRMVIAR